ncbi:MAG: alpha-2-macroglobulin family protein, partial [Mailhella sp.]
VRDSAGLLLASIPYAVAGERLAAPGTELASGKMRIRLDKNSYAAGETINIAMSLPYKGTGLITLERDGVAAFSWFAAEAGDTVQRIAVPEDFEGRGYVNVSFVRSPESPAVYMSPHTYAVAPFKANILQRDMKLSIEAPQTVLPGSVLKVKLRSREAGKAVLFAVDEGVLQLTRFATPSPLFTLLENRALDVRTIQAFDLIMPDHALMAGRVSAFGGGMDGMGNEGARFHNPFKRRGEPPLATWSNLLDVTPEGVSVDIPVPEYYNGRLRIMAVASSPHCAGSAAEACTSAAPLILTPQLPLTVSPGDEFEGALVLANTAKRSSLVRLEYAADNALSFITHLPEKVEVEGEGEVILPFSMKAKAAPGEAGVRFAALSGEKQYVRKSSLSVRPAAPMRTSIQAGMVQDAAILLADREVYAFGAHSAAAVSAMPLPLVSGLGRYLEKYPYGCTEQLISRAFAHVLLRGYPGILSGEKERAAAVEAALGAIRARLTDGGISLWPEGEPDRLLTVYAADFLLAMREAGFAGADDLLPRVCMAVENAVPLNSSRLEDARISAYGIWVLTREGMITTQLIENLQQALREREVQNWNSDMTALLIAASQKEMHMRRTQAFREIEYLPSGWFDELAQQALHVSLLERYFPSMVTDDLKNGMADSVIMALKGSRYATFSAAQSIRALMDIGSAAKQDMKQVKLTCADAEGEAKYASLFHDTVLSLEMPICRRYDLEMPASSPQLYWQVATSGFDRDPSRDAEVHGIEVERVFLNSRGEAVSSARQGEELTVRITARAMKNFIQDCVVSDLLPGGFEMVIARSSGEEGAWPSGVKFADRREDRMILFADLTNEPMTYTYRVRAVNRGTFSVPPLHAEAMYSQSIYGHSASGSMVVR